MINEQLDVKSPSIKFILHIVMALLITAVLCTAVWVLSQLLIGSFSIDMLADIGALCLGLFALGLTSGSLWHLYGYVREMVITLSTFNFYRTLIDKGSFELLIESYTNVVNTFEVPIQARHVDRNGEIIYGQWNGINDWKVWNKKQSMGWTGGVNQEKRQTTRKPRMKRNNSVKPVDNEV